MELFMPEEVLDDRALNESLDDDIRKTLASINARESEPEPDAPETPEAPERARAPDGKFAKTESVAPAEQPDKPPLDGAVEQVATDAPADPAAVPGAPQTVDLNRPPSSWKPAAKAAWQSLPEPIRAEIHRREFDFHNSTFKGPLKENADFGQSMRQVVEPYKALIEAEGGTYERAVADTMKTAALFRTGTPQQKLEALWEIDKRFNAGLNDYFARVVENEVAKRTGQPVPDQPAAQQTFQDPRVDTILASLQAQERSREQEEAKRAQAREAETNTAVQTFINAKSADGQPLYPFVDNVVEDMSARVQIIRRSNPAKSHEEALKEAYEQAVWANPETRAVLISQQQAQATQPLEKLQKVEQAKRANAGNLPKRGALPASGPALDLDESIRETGRALGMF